MAIEVTLTGEGFWNVRGEAAREGVLTIENAKAYVRAYHGALGCDCVEVEGAGLVEVDGARVAKLNVTTHHPDHGTDAIQWDVWEEYPGTLYGEC